MSRRYPGDKGGLVGELAALGERSRLKIIQWLAKGGERSVGEITAAMDGISQPSTSRHLAVLYDAGLVDARREGQKILYSIHPEAGAAAGRLRNLAAAIARATKGGLE